MRGLGVLVAVLAIAARIMAGGANTSNTVTPAITFRDVTQQSGVRFTHNNGAFGKKFLPETLGPGVAFIDYDGDGWQDLFFTNGKNWPGQPHHTSTLHLFRNNNNGTANHHRGATWVGVGRLRGDARARWNHRPT